MLEAALPGPARGLLIVGPTLGRTLPAWTLRPSGKFLNKPKLVFYNPKMVWCWPWGLCPQALPPLRVEPIFLQLGSQPSVQA